MADLDLDKIERKPFKVLDLFSGIGGFSLGLSRTGGFNTVGFCEIDPFCVKVLKKHWPHIPCYTDVRTLEYSEPVDLVTAGFPCQDISLAGKRASLTGERSGLFWHILRAAGMVGRPRLLLENVAALLNRGLAEVLGALATIGYDAEWHIVGSAHVGADHIRERIWIFADPSRVGCCGERSFEPRPPLLEVGGLVPKHDRTWPNARESFGASYGLPNRLDRIRALGNAVDPRIPELIGNAILASLLNQGEGP